MPDVDIGAPGPAEATARKAQRAQRVAAAALAIALAVVASILVALALVRPIHGIDADARAACETAIAVAAVMAARLLIEIFNRTRQLRELLLVVGVLALSLGDFSYWAGPMITGRQDSASDAALRLIWQLAGALALAGAALTPATSIVKPLKRRSRRAIVLGCSVLAAATLLGQVIAVHTPSTHSAAGHVVADTAQMLAAVITAVAALAFAARFWRAEHGTELVAGASLLLAAAGLQFVRLRSVPADWFTPHEGARLVAFALLLGGACLRYASVQRRDAYSAICSERERVARDLHDGLAQDLACITTQAQRFDCRMGPDHPLVLATRDALEELRGMIADLTASTAATSEEAVRLVARELGRRLDLDIRVHTEDDAALAVDGGFELSSRDDLIRATRDAIAKAADDGEARHVDLALSRQADSVVLRVGDWPLSVPEPAAIGVPGAARGTRAVSRLSAEWSRRARHRRPL